MPISPKYHARFKENCFYHVYNRTNNKEKLFRSDENKRYFMQLFDHYLSPFIELISWSLLDNHFHFEIKVKSENEIHETLSRLPFISLTPTEFKFLKRTIPADTLISRAFRKFFQSYTLAFNKYFKRQGNLFHKNFKRIEIRDNKQLLQTLIYIHRNPQEHGFVNDFREYPWSSWHSFVKPGSQSGWTKKITSLFGSKHLLTESHLQAVFQIESATAFIII
ncbi:MAG: transposase [Chitinophagaceae bacterium]|nr:transposase [Chitinophagaceae bacterium]MBL0334322.1 transposase [Chitinophagaceae bacterium]